MPTARYTADGGAYRVGGHHFEPGDEQAVDAELAAYLADVDDFEVIGGEDDVREEDGPPDVPVLAEDATVAEIEDAIATIESADAIRYILEDERKGPNRTTAIDALEARLDELEG